MGKQTSIKLDALEMPLSYMWHFGTMQFSWSSLEKPLSGTTYNGCVVDFILLQ